MDTCPNPLGRHLDKGSVSIDMDARTISAMSENTYHCRSNNANNNDADHPAHPRSLISIVVFSLNKSNLFNSPKTYKSVTLYWP